MLVKAKISDCDKQNKPLNSGSFYVQFNPNEISIEEACTTVTYGNSTNKDPQDKKDKHALSFSTTLFYNSFSSLSQKTQVDVRGYIRKFYPYTNSGENKKTKLKKICFTWGTLCIVGILEKLDVTYTSFASDGTPTRCSVHITITGSYYGDAPYKTGKKESELSEYTSFMSALSSYQDPSDWKKEARRKDIKKARTS